MALFGTNPYTPPTPPAVYSNPANIPPPLNMNPQPNSIAASVAPPQVPNNAQSTNGNGILWVQGEAGAKSFLVAAGNSVILMDSENPIFYIKSADQTGMPILRKFRFEEITNEQTVVQPTQPQINLDNYVTWDALNEKLEEYSKKRIKKEADNG